MEPFIGRKQELAELNRCAQSQRSEFVIVYGRRRIGKTFLVRHFLGNNITFSYVGVRGLATRQQLANFALALQEHSSSPFAPALANWMEAFAALRQLLVSHGGRKMVFLDEMPWMDSAKSDFVAALENFWNGWAATRDDICLIVCGSATSWMTEKLIYNQGGLHNRVTSSIYVRPFTLLEIEQYLDAKGCPWDRFQIAQGYMALGGVPYYWSLIHNGESLMQNIDRMFFGKNAILREEFNELFYSLFKNPDRYIDVVRVLSARREGLTRQQISDQLKTTGGTLTRVLNNLERCDFILGYAKFGTKSSNTIYRLADSYTVFYFKFIANERAQDELWWQHNINAPGVLAWQGLSFELVCLLHLRQIKQSLGIGGVATQASTWRSSDASHPYQIDLVIDRADRVINLCEMKFSAGRFAIDTNYATLLRDRRDWFVAQTKTRKTPVITLVTTQGVLPGKHAAVAQSQVTLDDLFAP